MKKLFTSALALAICGSSFAAEVANVNGKSISSDDFMWSTKNLGPQASRMLGNEQLKKRFLNHLIDNELLFSEATKKGLDKSSDFKKRLDSARVQLLASLYIDHYIAENTKENKMKEYFNKNKKEFNNQEVKASHILIKDKAQAEKVLKDAVKPKADFAELAKKHSEGPSAKNGGDLGFFTRGRMVPEFETAAFATAKGKVHPTLVKTQFGFHIIKVTDPKGGENVKFADVKEKVQQTMERNLRAQLVEDLRKTSKITIDDKALAKVKI